ncbi:MAG: potassium channel family protein, partial [Bacilli bacterium]
MSKKAKDVLVIGLGRFGMAVVNTLLERNQKLTVVDNNEEKINSIASRCEYAKVCDTKNEDVLKQLGVTNFDHVVVAIGSSIESSIITTLLLKDLGVENITVKASNKQHYQALLKLGVPERNVIMPEVEMGEKVAHMISCPIVADSFELEGESHSIVELHPQKFFLTGMAIKD